MFTAELLEIKNVCEKTFCFLFICKQTVELFFGIWMLLVSFWLCFALKPYCCKLFRHVNSYQDQVFFTFSQGISLPCAVLTCAYWLSGAQYDPCWNSHWWHWATSAHEKRESEQRSNTVQKYLDEVILWQSSCVAAATLKVPYRYISID